MEEPVQLCSIGPGTQLAGLSRHGDAESIVVSVSGAGVQVHRIAEQMLAESFTVPRTRPLACAAVQHGPSRSYFAALLSPPEIRCWNESDAEVDFASAQQCALVDLPKVSRLHAVPCLNGAVLAVFEDASIAIIKASASRVVQSDLTPLHAGAKGKSKKSPAAAVRIVWSRAVHIRAVDGVVLLVAFADESGAYHLGSATVNCASFSFSSIAVAPLAPPSESSIACLQCCFCWPQLVASIWSDGSLCVYEVSHGGVVVPPEDGGALKPRLVQRLSGIDLDAKVAMCAVARAQVAVCSREIGNKSLRISVWDLTFGTVQKSATVPCDKKEFPVQALGLSKQTFALGTTHQVLFVEPGITPSTLSSMLGKLADCLPLIDQDHGAAISRPAVTTLLRPAGEAATSAWFQQGVAETEQTEKLVEAVEKAKNSAGLKKAFAALIASFPTKQEAVNAPEKPIVPQDVAVRVCSKCLSLKSKDVTAELLAILRTDCVSTNAIPDLLPQVVEWNDISLIQACLLHVHDLSEASIVESLQRLMPESLAMDLSVDDVSLEIETPFEAFLRLVIWSAAWSDHALVEALRPLPLEHALVLLQYSSRWLQWLSQSSETKLRKKLSRVPKLSQVVDWLSCVLDAHFSKLLLSSESHAVLLDLTKNVQLHTELNEQLRDLHGVLQNYLSRKRVPTLSNRVGAYSIEILHLP